MGDRRWSVRTAAGKIGSGKSTRRFFAVEGLLLARAEERDGGDLRAGDDRQPLRRRAGQPPRAGRMSEGDAVTLE